MKLFFKLIFREACVHRVRLALALLAIIATSCMSVWIIGGFDQLSAQKRDTAENYLGAYQLVLSPPAGMAGGPGGGMGRGGGMRGGRPGMGSPGGMGARPEGAPGVMGEKPNAESAPGEAKPGEGKPETGGRPEGMGGAGGMGGFGGGMGGGRPNMRALSPLTPQVIAMLRNDEDVVSVDTAMQCFGVQSALADENFSVYDRIRQGMGTPMGSALVVGINTTESPFKLEDGRWFDTVVTGYPKDSQDVLECVVGSSAMKQMRPMGDKDKRKAEIGSIIQFYYNGVENKAKIVGVFQQGMSSSAPIQRGAPGAAKIDTTPKPVQITQGAIYVPLGAAAKLADCDPRTDLVYIKLKDGTDVKAFREKYEKIFAEKESPLIFQDVNDVRTALTENQTASSILKQAYASIGLVLVAATFIIFTTLSMGVNERTRQLALLRCIGLSSGQIFFLIVGEAVLLGVLGGIGGLVAGYGLLWTSQVYNGNSSAVELSGLCIGLTFLCSIGGALLASIIPGFRAARTKPIDALQESQFIPPHSWAWRSAVVGLILSSVTPLIVYGNIVSGALQKTLYGGLGLVLMSIGFLLLIPALIIISEKIFTPIASAIFGIPSVFLHGQLTRSLWRSVGTVISISVGLGLYCFFEIWGYSMLVPFTPTHDMPEALVAFFPKGISDANIEKVKACKA
ncbi:MAG: ABC transporter permease, partial [Thermoguttaceae bacterium]|nr:ABC transporter permease [Thermoguttaceae bacterium]